MQVIDTDASVKTIFDQMAKNGTTVKEIAYKLGLSPCGVYAWRRAGRMPSLDNLLAISEIFGVELTELIKTKEV